MRSSNKDRFSRNSVHVDAGACLHVVQVDVPILSNQIQDIVLGADLKSGLQKQALVIRQARPNKHKFDSGDVGNVQYLHGYGEIILCFRREEYVNVLLDERLVPCRRCSNFDDMQLK